MHSTPSLRLVHTRRRALGARMNEPSLHQLDDGGVLTFESSNGVDNDHAERHHRITRLSSQASISGSSLSSSSQQSLIIPPTPSPSMTSIPTSPPVYLESQRLMDSILAVSCIILHSYVLAYDRVYGGPQSSVQFYHYAKTPKGSLLRRLLLGRRTGLISAEEFLQYRVTFPTLTPDPDSNTPPLSSRFEFPVLRYPRIYRIPIYPVNAPSMMLRKADWDGQVQEFLEYYRPHVYEPESAARERSSTTDTRRIRRLEQAPIFPLRREIQFSRNAPRAIKPLPKRASLRAAGAARVSQSTVLGVVARTVVDVGSVIVRGVKRLKEGLEEGGVLKKRRLL